MSVLGGGGERVSASIASPCVRSKRPRVYRHEAYQAHIFHTCGLGAGTHADVLNVHTGVFTCFSPCRTTPHHTHQTHTTTTNDTTTTTTQHGDRNRERKRRRDKTRRQDKRREKMKEKREFDSTQENTRSPDTVRIDRLKALS